MKKLLLSIILVLGAVQFSYAQDDVYISNKPPRNTHQQGEHKTMKKHKGVNPAFCRKAYVGFSYGVNNPAGIIGFDVDVPLLKHLSIGAGFGASTWGNKIYFDARYYLKPCHRGFAFGAGVTHNTGNNNFTSNLETIYGTDQVTLKLDPQTNLFIGAYYFWTVGRRYNRMYLEAGYSIPFAECSYALQYGSPLSSTGEAEVKLLSPGGIMIGMGFSFGIH